MLKTTALVIEAAIVVGVVAYFAIEGFSGNLAVTVILALVATTSIALLGGALAKALAQMSRAHMTVPSNPPVNADACGHAAMHPGFRARAGYRAR